MRINNEIHSLGARIFLRTVLSCNLCTLTCDESIFLSGSKLSRYSPQKYFINNFCLKHTQCLCYHKIWIKLTSCVLTTFYVNAKCKKKLSLVCCLSHFFSTVSSFINTQTPFVKLSCISTDDL